MPVRLTKDAMDIVHCAVLAGHPITAEGLQATVDGNPLLGFKGSLGIAQRALEQVGREGLLALAHADGELTHPSQFEALAEARKTRVLKVNRGPDS